MKSLHELKGFETLARATEFYELGRALLRARHGGTEYLATAAGRRTPERVQRILKAPVAAGTIGEQGALVDAQIVSNGFVASLSGLSVFDTMMSAMRRMPYDLPGVRVLSAIQGHDVAEGAPKPISGFSVDPRTLEPQKATAIIVVSAELADSLDVAAALLINNALSEGVIAAADMKFLSVLADSVSPLPSAGSTAANVLADIENALDAIPTGAASKLYMVVSATTAKHLSTRSATTGSRAFPDMGPAGGEVAGITTLVSDHLPTAGSPAAPLVLLVDASQVAVADLGVRLDIARHAAIQMDTAPDGGAGPLTSLWQTNSRAVRAERRWRAVRIRDTAVATLAAAW